MTWNWEQHDWPTFSWDPNRLRKAEEVFLVGSGLFTGILRHLGKADREQLTIDAMSDEAVTTSEIEGEVLDRTSVQSSIRNQFGLAVDERRAGPAERGIAEMLVNLHRTFAQPLSSDMLFHWHRMLFTGRRDLNDLGCYRTSNEPMQIVSGPVRFPRVHFGAPPVSAVPAQMEGFIDWFNQTAPDGPQALPALTRAGIAHLYFESIHPFVDGNGRIGRAISEKALSQCLGQPTLTALAATVLLRRKAYYKALARQSTETSG